MMKLCRYIVILALVLILATGTLSAQAENFELPYFLNQFEGTQLNLQQFWGKSFLIFFFTESSPDCAQQFGEIKKIYETYSADELQIIMIHEWANETEENTQRIIEQYDLQDLYFFEDTDMGVAKKTRIPGIPTTLFMDSSGYLHDAYAFGGISYPDMAEVLDSIGISRIENADSSAGAPVEAVPMATPAATVAN